MSPHDDPLKQDEYRLILVRSGSHAIWTERDANKPRLPRVFALKWRRPAEQLQEVIEAAWTIRVILLDFLPANRGSVPCVIAEILSAASDLRLTPTAIDEIPVEEMNLEEREVLQAILDCNAGTRGPFSRAGWIKEALEWLRTEVGSDLAFTESIRQYNASGRFALLRFRTHAGSVLWLKATGEPNAHEFHVTRHLVDLCPEFLPAQIAAREDWNAWLMEDAGQSFDSLDLPALELAVLSMATLQKRTLGRTSEFQAAGAIDQRIGTLRAHLAELIDYLQEAMAKQISTKAPRLDSHRLSRLEAALRDACFRMEDLEIPDALVHNDVNPGNILFNETRCVFTDWCETGVGNPFIGFEYLSLLQPCRGEDWRPRLRKIYGQCWLDCLGASQVGEAFALAPLLAMLSNLYGRGTWLHTSRRNAPHVEGYARSLARQMDRVVQNSLLQGALCQ